MRSSEDEGIIRTSQYRDAVEFPFPVAPVQEGAASLLVPDVARRKGPGTAGPWPFYNPTMAVNRDLSATVLAKWPRPLKSVLDGLAATGVWGIRMALEADAGGVVFNDWSPESTELIRENVRRNGLVADVHLGDLRPYLREGQYDFVDVDPFGPPTPFLDSVFDSVNGSSGIGIMATDTAVLCGTYPKACQKRYAARPFRSPQGAEIGLRILLGYCCRIARRRGLHIRPILAFSAEHFLRTIVMISSGSAPTPIGRVIRDQSGDYAPATSRNTGAIGPLWLGPLGDPAVVHKLQPSGWTSVASARLLSLLKTECEMPLLFVTTDELAARAHRSPPKLDRFIDGLHGNGYRATRTHFHPRGVKTDAPSAECERLFRELSPTGSTGDSRPAS